MKVMVTGAQGQLGIDIVQKLEQNYDVIGLNKYDLDITNLDRVIQVVNEVQPDIIINSAAYTNVDGCEENTDLAYRINGIGAKNLAIATLENKAKLVQISTDFVFDGEKKMPYIEFDETKPLSIYGKSKLAGEQCIRDICQRHFILRTAWLYGEHGSNFVKTMLKLGEERDTLTVVDDQFGSPTYTKDLVNVIERLIETEAYGVYHASNGGECSWNDFARKIFELSGNKKTKVLPISSEAFGRPAKRPAYSVMENYMLKLQLDYGMRDWEEALRDYFKI